MTRAVLFDAVDTLIRPRPSVGAVYARAAAAHGVRCRGYELEWNFRPAYRELIAKRFYGPGGLRTSESRERAWWRRLVALTFERAGCTLTGDAVLDEAFEAFGRGAAWRLHPGAMATLERLASAGLRVGVVSNYDARLHRVLEELGLAPLLSVVAISSEVGWAKPSPRIYRYALERLGVPAAETLMVGDRHREDVEGAHAAGLRALLFDPGGTTCAPHAIRKLSQVTKHI